MDKGELKLKVVGNKGHAAQMWNLPTGIHCDGWIPHFNLSEQAQGAELRVAKIPPKWYGKVLSIQIFPE